MVPFVYTVIVTKFDVILNYVSSVSDYMRPRCVREIQHESNRSNMGFFLKPHPMGISLVVSFFYRVRIWLLVGFFVVILVLVFGRDIRRILITVLVVAYIPT